jgi:transposase
MLYLSSTTNYYLCTDAMDMRKGIFSLCGVVTNNLKQNILLRDVFVFINRKRDTIKLLQWDGDGFALYEKKLAKGTFEHQQNYNEQTMLLTNYQLQLILQGIIVQNVKIKKRIDL